MSDILIRAEQASLQLGNRQVLSAVDFEIIAGEIAIFIGPNGGGKTSLVKMLLGLYPATEGLIERKAGLKISYVPQKFEISPFLPLTVKRLLNFTQKYDDETLVEALETTDCEHLLGAQVKQLSGGELQRVLLARAMISKPDILVLDEALQGVDQAGEVQLNNLISSYSKQYGTAILMVSHDLHLVMKSTDKVYCINGHICCHGKPEQVQHMDEFKDIFGSLADQFAVYTHKHDHNHELGHEHDENCNHEH
ncbi:MAG: ATP-binding cassette domain-containing protein [Alphaproteobacteria bacterium]|nr:ATP-binding cassette domain-containing protein [Alphaproteobacteria bacterium]